MHRAARCILAVIAVGSTTLSASAEIITYRTTLTLTPSSITVAGNNDNGVFTPNDPEFAADPGRWLALGDAFELTLTVDTGAPLVGFDTVFGRFHEVESFVVGSSFRPLPTNTGLLSRAFQTGPSLFPTVSARSNGLQWISGSVWLPDQPVFISYLDFSIDVPINLAGEGQPIGSLMPPLDGMLVIPGYAQLSGTPLVVDPDFGDDPLSNIRGSVQFQASPLERVIPSPGAAAVLGLAGLLASRRRR